MGMTIAQAITELEVSAETGQCSSEAVRTLKEALTLRETRADRRAWRERIISHLHKIALGPSEVLVLRLPAEVIADPAQMRGVQAAARDIGEVARRGVVIMQEGTPLTAEAVLQSERPRPTIHVPGRISLPPGVRR